MARTVEGESSAVVAPRLAEIADELVVRLGLARDQAARDARDHHRGSGHLRFFRNMSSLSRYRKSNISDGGAI